MWTERATRDGMLTLGDAVIDLARLWVEVDEESTFDRHSREKALTRDRVRAFA